MKKTTDSKESTFAGSSDYDYNSLMESLTNCIKTSQEKQRGDSHRDFEPIPYKYFYIEYPKKSKFKTPEGNPIPGLKPSDSVGASIEIVKMYLEKELGDQKFTEAYRFLEVNFFCINKNKEPPKSNSLSGNAMLSEILGKSGIKYIPLLYQLLVHEGVFYEKEKANN